jgi:hypothetical protein
MDLWHRNLDLVDAQLDSALSDIPRHRHLRTRCAVLNDDPLPDAPSGVTLFLRSRLILDEPTIDDRGVRSDRRPRPGRILLTRRRHRRGKRLTHRTAMHPMPLC